MATLIDPNSTSLIATSDPNTSGNPTPVLAGEQTSISTPTLTASSTPIDNAANLAAGAVGKTPEQLAKEQAELEAKKKFESSRFISTDDAKKLVAEDQKQKLSTRPTETTGARVSTSTSTPQAYAAVPEGEELTAQMQQELNTNAGLTQSYIDEAKLHQEKAAKAAEERRLMEIKIEADKNAEVASLMSEHSKDMKLLQEKVQSDVAALQRGLDKSIQEFANARINPDFYRDRSTGQRIAGAIAIAMGTYASAMGAGPNVALKIIDDAIQRDLDLQQAEIAKKGTVVQMQSNQLAQAMQLGLNQMEARKLVHASMLEGAKQDIQVALLQVRGTSEYSKLQVAQTQNTIDAQIYQLKADVANSQYNPTIQKYGVITQLQQQKIGSALESVRIAAEKQKEVLKGMYSFGNQEPVIDESGGFVGYPTISNEAVTEGEAAYRQLETAAALKAKLDARSKLVQDIGYRSGKEADMDRALFLLDVRNLIMANAGALDKDTLSILDQIIPAGTQTLGMEAFRTGWKQLSKGIADRSITRYKAAMLGARVPEKNYAPGARSLITALDLKPGKVN